jgi:RNA polymerase sigma-70 factor (sigma-E family)
VSARRDEEFTHYVTTRLGTLRRIAYLLCQDWQQADDLVQAAITRLYVRWDRVAAVEHIDAYARAVLVREFLGERRTGWARRVSLGAAVPDTAGPVPDTDASLDVRSALAGLPPRQRATLVLRFYCDLPVGEAARLLGCSPGTVKSQTAKAIAALRSQLTGDQPPTPPARTSHQPATPPAGTSRQPPTPPARTSHIPATPPARTSRQPATPQARIGVTDHG